MSAHEPEPRPEPKPPRPRRACWYCGGTDITRRVLLGEMSESGQLGLQYYGPGVLGIRIIGTEPLRANLCNECGTVLRLSVAVIDRDWVQQPQP